MINQSSQQNYQLYLKGSTKIDKQQMKTVNKSTKKEPNVSNALKLSNPNIIITNIEQKQNLHSSQSQHVSLQSLLSQIIVQSSLALIFDKVNEQVFENKCIRNKMAKYSGKFAQSYLEQTTKMHLDNSEVHESFNDDTEPQPLRSDNFIPVGTNIEQQVQSDRRSVKDSLSGTTLGKFPRNSSLISRAEKLSSLSQSQAKISNNFQAYVKLNNEEKQATSIIETDPFVQEMRRQKDAKLKQTEGNKKAQKKSNLREIIKKDEKISYDFTGEIIKLKQNQKPNFAPNIVQVIQNPTLKIKQKSFIDLNPVNLNNNNRKGSDNKKVPSKKISDIQFSNIMSLTPQLQIHEGIKFTHGKNIIEKKKKQPSISELKKTISTKRFNKNDFERLKSLGDHKSMRRRSDSPSLPTILKSESDANIDRNDSILGRSMSEAKFQSRSKFSLINRGSVLDKSQDRMSIQNQELTEMLLVPVHNSVENLTTILRAQQDQNNLEKQMIKLNHIDHGNLNFIKTGSVGKVELPKISFRINTNQTLKQPHPITLLESKTKLKGKRKQNQFERLRKHFQDKLRT